LLLLLNAHVFCFFFLIPFLTVGRWDAITAPHRKKHKKKPCPLSFQLVFRPTACVTMLHRPGVMVGELLHCMFLRAVNACMGSRIRVRAQDIPNVTALAIIGGGIGGMQGLVGDGAGGQSDDSWAPRQKAPPFDEKNNVNLDMLKKRVGVYFGAYAAVVARDPRNVEQLAAQTLAAHSRHRQGGVDSVRAQNMLLEFLMNEPYAEQYGYTSFYMTLVENEELTVVKTEGRFV
jgi:hypothetical protein